VAPSDYRVVVSSAAWQLNGVNIFAEHLVRGLRGRGVDAHMYFTEQDTWLVQLPKEMMPFPSDIPSVSIAAEHKATWEAHWYETVRYLESLAPCIYLPNSDYRHSCVSPLLSPDVLVAALIQSDDPIHYEHVHRLGRYWDAIVCVSEEIADKVARQDPEFSPRVRTIPNTVVVPSECPRRDRNAGDPIRIVYHGVLNSYQKRITHIPRILEELDRRGVPFRMTLAGDGPQREELLELCRPWLHQGTMEYKGIVAHHDVDRLLCGQDAYVMTSAFEGMPHAVLEAMAQGCVPVVTRIDSGIPELVKEGESGYLIPVGDFGAFADRFAELQRDAGRLERMSLAAHAAIQRSRFNVDAMVEAYLTLFEEMWSAAREGRFERPRGTVLPPPAVVNGLSIFPCETCGYVEQVEKMRTDRLPGGSGRSPGVLTKIWNRLRGS
jgi:glycosyltransferase involved in cell wall biosynthesis